MNPERKGCAGDSSGTFLMSQWLIVWLFPECAGMCLERPRDGTLLAHATIQIRGLSGKKFDV